MFLGLGNTSVRYAAWVTVLLLEAVGLSGQRAIVHTGWARLLQPASLGGRLVLANSSKMSSGLNMSPLGL